MKTREDEGLRDDARWQRAVESLGLGPSIEELERAAAPPAAEPATRLGRLQVRIARLPQPARALVSGSLLLLATLALAALLTACKALLLAVGRGLPALLGDRPLEFHASAAHVVALSLALVVLASSRAPAEPVGLVARRAWRQFRRGWALLWISWLALYLWLTAYWGFGGVLRGGGWGSSVADLLNVASAAVFLYLFLVLDRPSVKAEGAPERDREFRRSLAGVGIVCGATALVSISGRLGVLGLTDFGPAVGSILGAISMAFFVGRLSDSHLDVRRSLLAPLYFYVALQMLWHLFVMAGGENQVANALVLFGALVLKVYLFALVTRWIQDEKLQTYFDEVAYPRLPSDLPE